MTALADLYATPEDVLWFQVFDLSSGDADIVIEGDVKGMRKLRPGDTLQLCSLAAVTSCMDYSVGVMSFFKQ